MKLLASPEAVRYVRKHGGSLFVWADRTRCCPEITFLEASTESPGADRTFRRMRGQAFELCVDLGGRDVPEEIHIDLKGRRRKQLRAYWNGHSYAP